MARATIEKIETNARHKFYRVTFERGPLQAKITIIIRRNASEDEVHREYQKRITNLRQTINNMEVMQ